MNVIGQDIEAKKLLKLDYALKYADIGWCVLPLHFMTENGCSCGHKCKSPGKHPIETGGFKNASIIKAKITEWWGKYPHANIGIATGKISGIFVLDIDPKSGGEDSLDEIESKHGKTPDSVLAVTGSGGRHYVFKYPGVAGRCSTNIYPGIDTRGDGGYIVAAPSNHASGNDYFWDSEADPLEGAVPADAPPWLLQKLTQKQTFSKSHTDSVSLHDDEVKNIRAALVYVPADNRDDWLNIGMALHATKANDQAFGLWCEWSQQLDKFNLADQRRVWDSFTASGGLTIATLFGIAKNYGWSKPSPDRPPEPPIEAYISEFDSNCDKSKKPLNKRNKKPTSSEKKNKQNQEELTDIFSRYIFNSSRNRILDTNTGKEMTREGFDGLFLHIHQNPKASTYLLKHPDCVKVDDLIYIPGCTKNPVKRGSSFLWNIWSDPNVDLPEFATDKDVEPWLNHLDYLYPNHQQQQHILDWFGFLLQHLDIKINHALLLAGNTRIGKDLLLNPLRYGLGEKNVCEPPASELKEIHTDYLHHIKLVILQEIMNFGGLDQENKLKNVLASPPFTLRIRLFGRGFYETPNLVQAILMSNFRDATHVSEGDGRYYALWSDVKPKSEEYYKGFFDWLKIGGNALVVRWLLNRDVTGFNPKKPATITPFKSELIKTSHSPLKHLMLDMIESMDYPFNVDCVRSYDVEKVLRNKYSSKSIGIVLSGIGCKQRDCRRATGKRGTVSLYCVRVFDDWNDKSIIKWLDEYDARKK